MIEKKMEKCDIIGSRVPIVPNLIPSNLTFKYAWISLTEAYKRLLSLGLTAAKKSEDGWKEQLLF